MGTDQLLKAADRARTLLKNRVDVGSVGVSRDRHGDLCVRVDVYPRADKAAIRHLLQSIEAPVLVRSVSGALRAHGS